MWKGTDHAKVPKKDHCEHKTLRRGFCEGHAEITGCTIEQKPRNTGGCAGRPLKECRPYSERLIKQLKCLVQGNSLICILKDHSP